MMQNLDPLSKAEKQILKQRETLGRKFPVTFGLTATFGLVSVLYAFEKIIDKIPIFVNNPWILMVVGLSLLLATGAAIRKLY